MERNQQLRRPAPRARSYKESETRAQWLFAVAVGMAVVWALLEIYDKVGSKLAHITF